MVSTLTSQRVNGVNHRHIYMSASSWITLWSMVWTFINYEKNDTVYPSRLQDPRSLLPYHQPPSLHRTSLSTLRREEVDTGCCIVSVPLHHHCWELPPEKTEAQSSPLQVSHGLSKVLMNLHFCVIWETCKSHDKLQGFPCRYEQVNLRFDFHTLYFWFSEEISYLKAKTNLTSAFTLYRNAMVSWYYSTPENIISTFPLCVTADVTP